MLKPVNKISIAISIEMEEDRSKYLVKFVSSEHKIETFEFLIFFLYRTSGKVLEGKEGVLDSNVLQDFAKHKKV